MVEVTIRDARDEDAGAIAGLLGQLGYPAEAAAIPGRLERMRAETGQHTFVAVVDGEVVGTASVIVRHVIGSDAPFGRLASIVVDEEWRSRGIGERLVRETERICRAAGCSAVEVTSAMHRPRAHQFYERLGYTERRARFIKPL